MKSACLTKPRLVYVKGHPFLFDARDLPLVQRTKWQLSVDKAGKKRLLRQVGTGASRSNVYIYQVIVGIIPDSHVVDHINGNTSDNRRANLRVCTYTQNQMNRRPSKGKAIPYKGVIRKGGGFVAQLKAPKGLIRTRQYSTPQQAALQYDNLASHFYGDFAWLNSSHFSELAQDRNRDHD